MYEVKIFNSEHRMNGEEKSRIVDFLFNHLENYGDKKECIQKAVGYSLQEFQSDGGFTMVLKSGDEMLGAAVVNRTGMGGYIPENILVYIATHRNCRGKGLGSVIMKKIIENTEGDIALHVEAANPAKKLYEKFGFTNPYLEMRLKK